MRTAESCPVAAPRQDTDPDRWPDVLTPPDTSRARTAVTRALLRRALERLPLQARFADGTRVGTGGPVIEIHDPAAFHRRIGAQGLIGFGESYMAGSGTRPTSSPRSPCSQGTRHNSSRPRSRSCGDCGR